MNGLLAEERVLQLIHQIRNQIVMLDSDRTAMYGVPTKRLNEKVKRNPDRFPVDFMFQLDEKEWASNYVELATEIKELQDSESTQNHQRARIYQIIEELLKPTLTERNEIGFKK